MWFIIINNYDFAISAATISLKAISLAFLSIEIQVFDFDFHISKNQYFSIVSSNSRELLNFNMFTALF